MRKVDLLLAPVVILFAAIMIYVPIASSYQWCYDITSPIFKSDNEKVLREFRAGSIPEGTEIIFYKPSCPDCVKELTQERVKFLRSTGALLVDTSKRDGNDLKAEADVRNVPAYTVYSEGTFKKI